LDVATDVTGALVPRIPWQLERLGAVDAERLGVLGTSFSGGHVLHLGAYDTRVKVVVIQVGATDLYARRVTSSEQF
jgi:hypothetical protein